MIEEGEEDNNSDEGIDEVKGLDGKSHIVKSSNRRTETVFML